MSRANTITIPEKTVAIRPVRMDVENNHFCYYEAFQFPNGGIWQILMQCGGITTDRTDYMIDFMQDEWTMLDSVAVTHKVFYAIVKRLKAKRDMSSEMEFKEYLEANRLQP